MSRIDWRGLRRALGLTQREMAQLLCLSRQEVGNLERGHRRNVHAGTLMHLRAWLQSPELCERLRGARFPHPFPEDCQIDAGA